jgi:hypothetical protein
MKQGHLSRLLLAVALSLSVAQAARAQDEGWTEVTGFVHPEDPDTFVIQYVYHYGGTNALAVQEQYTPFGVIIVTDEPTEGSTTSPSGPLNPNAPTPPRNGASDAENAVAGVIVQGGYTVVQQPKPIPANDPFRTKYPNSDPDYKIEGRYFDLYSPQNTTPAGNVASNVNDKAGGQVDRIIIEFPPGTTPQRIQDVIDEIQVYRNTPDSGTRKKLEEMWIIKPDRTIEKIFPGGRLR